MQIFLVKYQHIDKNIKGDNMETTSLLIIYDAPILQLGSRIYVRHVFVSDTLGYFIDTYQ